MNTAHENIERSLTLPAVRFAPLFALGIILAGYMPNALSAFFLAIATACAILLIFREKGRVFIIGLTAGTLLMLGYINLWCAPILDYNGKTITTEMTVTEIKSKESGNTRFIALADIDGYIAQIEVSGDDMISVGDKVTAELSLSRAVRSQYNWDTRLYGYVQEYHQINTRHNIIRIVHDIRTQLIATVSRHLTGDVLSMTLAMVFGESDAFSLKQADMAAISGLSHYTAVSGSHFVIISTIFLSCIGFRSNKSKAVVAAGLAIILVLFFGTDFSVIRAAIMFTLCNIAPLFDRKAVTLNSLCVAVIIILLLSPAAIYDVGFLLSVLGVFGVTISGNAFALALKERIPAKMHMLSPLITALCTSVGATICTAPVTIATFGGISLVGAVSSIVLLPVMECAMFLTIALIATKLPLMAVPVAIAMKVVCFITEVFSCNRGFWLALDHWLAPVVAALCAVTFTLAGLFHEKMFWKAFIGALTLSFVLLGTGIYYSDSRRTIDFVSNGSSGAAVICSGNTAALFVAGDGVALTEQLMWCIRENGIHSISLIAAPDISYGGALALTELTEIIKTDYIYSEEDPLNILTANTKAEVMICNIDTMNSDGLTIAIADVANQERSADIVMYTGHKKTAPQNSAGTAVYLSYSQEILPPNGVSVPYDRPEIPLKDKPMIITINER